MKFGNLEEVYLTPLLRAYYIFFRSRAGLFSVKIRKKFLAIKNFSVNETMKRKCFSESEGTCFGAPGQKALPSMNEFTLLWIFA